MGSSHKDQSKGKMTDNLKKTGTVALPTGTIELIRKGNGEVKGNERPRCAVAIRGEELRKKWTEELN